MVDDSRGARLQVARLMELRELFSPGSKLADVPIHFRGMTLLEWRGKNIEKQCNEYLKTLDPDKAPISQKRIWTPRDGYGMKGF